MPGNDTLIISVKPIIYIDLDHTIVIYLMHEHRKCKIKQHLKHLKISSFVTMNAVPPPNKHRGAFSKEAKNSLKGSYGHYLCNTHLPIDND